jgi:hypothetical protein
MAHRQALEGFPCNIGRIFRFVHERAGGGSGLLDKQQKKEEAVYRIAHPAGNIVDSRPRQAPNCRGAAALAC